MGNSTANPYLPNQRYAFVDIAKGFAIIAVVLWHINFASDFNVAFPLKTILGGGWHVPAFFIISGFFLKEERLLAPFHFAKSKLKTIYLWTIAIYIPAILMHNFFFKIGFYSSGPNLGYSQTLQPYTSIDFIKKVIEALLFAGREPIVSPLWFAYVLCLALIGYSLITFFSQKIWKDKYPMARACICLFLSTVSSVLSNHFDWTINRFSNTLVVLSLLCCGQYLFQIKKVKFDSLPIFLCAVILSWQNFLFNGNILLNDNKFHDLFHIAIGSTCALYVICFLSKKIEGSLLGNGIQIVGKKSFYIMGLHLLAFKDVTSILHEIDESVNLARLTPLTDNNALLIAIYLVAGVGLPIIFAYLWEFLYHMAASRIKAIFCRRNLPLS